MKNKKLLAIIVMFASLAAIFAGLPYLNNNYTNQTVTQNPVFSDSIVVPVNGTGTIHFILNGTEADYYLSETIRNGAIRAASLNKEDYARWVNGSFRPPWHYGQPTTGGGDAEYWEMFQNAPIERYYVYWNPDTPTSKEVTIKICEQTTETVCDYATLGTGIALIAGGAIAGLAAAYALGRRVLFTIVAVAMIVLGTSMLTSYYQQELGQETVGAFALTVPALSTINEPIHYNATGYYQLTLRVPKGQLNATVVSEEEFADFQAGKLDVYIRPWQGSHYPISGTISYDRSPTDVRLLLVNPEVYDEEVTVIVEHVWIEDDYSSQIGGAVLIVLGAAVLFFAHRRQLGAFNRALENQE